ncbi:cell division protein FtsZ [Marinobacterium sp. AK62]|uniref:Cell division protein FtsZ n=1 Tax=Marinobacterium alkalitolerans TaxID=1542925 RepID=A0ABS3ZCZ1_9GAMM|nr:cell division protein FtsZ [Marinobacterium alkalitolerans]MBP0049570.1 cell division protein FtsZ [Marinobacterium alkalitolerans]
MFELVDSVPQSAVIKVVGVGGGGGNAVNHMVTTELEGVEFICANTDAQALNNMSAKTALHIGGELTKGLGAGANPEIGRQAAVEDRERIASALSGADMVFITAGMGGGTGTGAAPIVAEVAREMGILTVAVVTKPFPFEGRRRKKVAEEGIRELQENVDSLIIIPNEKLLPVLGKNCTLVSAFGTANDVLKGAVQGIADLIIRPGMINVDFADVRTVMSEMGMAMMGTGVARGENRAREAAEAAINSPLLEDIDLKGASGVLVNITAGLDLSLGEFSEVGDLVEDYAHEDATVVVGTVIDPELSDELKVTVVATGLERAQSAESRVVNGSTTTATATTSVKKTAPTSDYSQLELPTVLRNRQNEEAPAARAVADKAADSAADSQPMKKTGTDDMDFLDIPAFLRRQAD